MKVVESKIFLDKYSTSVYLMAVKCEDGKYFKQVRETVMQSPTVYFKQINGSEYDKL